MSAIQYLDGEAMRAAAGHAMARLHQTFDLVLCPAVPGGPPLADAPTVNPVQALCTSMGAVDLHVQHHPPAGDYRADGAGDERPASVRATRRGAV